MRPFLGGLCAVAALALVGNPAAASNPATPVHETPAAATRLGSTACLGGVIAESHTADYLSVADYPAFAAPAAGLRRIFICGDSIPSFLPSAERVGFTPRRR